MDKLENQAIQSAVKAFNKDLDNVVSKIASKYKLQNKELLECFLDFKYETKNVPKKSDKSDKKQCSATVVSSGTQCTANVSDKSVSKMYCARHLGNEKEKPEGKRTGRPSKKDQLKEAEASVIKELNENKNKLTLKRNKFNNFEDPETHFVFDRNTKQVIGKQKENGEIEQLSVSDIEECKLRKFTYLLPETLTRERDVNSEDEKETKLSDDEIGQTSDNEE